MTEIADRISIAAHIYTLLEILGLFFLKKAIFSLWNLIITLQFFTLIALWQIKYPFTLRYALFKLREITLGEFLDRITIFNDFFGTFF